MLSLWQKQSFYFPTDIAIVGAGLTGLLTAIKLKEEKPALSIRILEKGIYPEGASVKNAGFACFGSVSEILDDIRNEGETKAFDRVSERFRGLQLLFETVDPRQIDLRANGGVEVFTPAEESILEKSLEAVDFINSKLKGELGFAPFTATRNTFGLKVLGTAIAIQGEATLNSGKLMRQLLAKAHHLGVEVNFGITVTGMNKDAEDWRLQTPSGDFKASKVLLATNGFTSALLPSQPVLPARGQILLTSKIPGLKLDRSFHLNQGYFYFRDYKGAVLLGGGRHIDRENEITTSQDTSQIIEDHLEQLLRDVILPGKKFTIEQKWAGTMAFGPKNEKEAIITEVENGVYLAARLGGMGVAMISIVSKKTKNLILS